MGYHCFQHFIVVRAHPMVPTHLFILFYSFSLKIILRFCLLNIIYDICL